MEIIIPTGMSGAGKTQAAHTLEDLNFLCIDNMPVLLIPQFAEIYSKNPQTANNVVFVIDVRGESEFNTLIEQIEHLKEKGFSCKMVFISCAKDVLINRYKENRRIHPLVASKSLSTTEAIETEIKMLQPLREQADYVIDTTHTSTQQLHNKIISLFRRETKKSIVVNCMSFGFKHGLPTDSDLVFDVRCFPNPYYIPELKKKTGLDSEVRDYVFSFKQTEQFLEKAMDMIDFLLPLYIEEGKSQLTIAVGCTGGHHRSVAITERLRAHLNKNGYDTILLHRDIER